MALVYAWNRRISDFNEKLPYREVKVWGENADRYFPDADSITKWIDQPSLVPFKAILQPPSRDFFRDLVVQKMLDSLNRLTARISKSSAELMFPPVNSLPYD